MENQIEHFLPKGQTEIEDSIFICDDTIQCETCSSFLYTLSVAQIKAFVEDDDFTFDCSAVRVIIPANKNNAEYLTVDVIQKLFQLISRLELEEEKEFVEWDKTRSILTVTPIFIDSETGEVGLCLDILLKYIEVQILMHSQYQSNNINLHNIGMMNLKLHHHFLKY
jgi:hypothetical protein